MLENSDRLRPCASQNLVRAAMPNEKGNWPPSMLILFAPFIYTGFFYVVITTAPVIVQVALYVAFSSTAAAISRLVMNAVHCQ